MTSYERRGTAEKNVKNVGFDFQQERRVTGEKNVKNMVFDFQQL